MDQDSWFDQENSNDEASRLDGEWENAEERVGEKLDNFATLGGQKKLSTPPELQEIHEDRQRLIEKQRIFRQTAQKVALRLAEISAVQRVVLFGSVANPLREEIPRYARYRRWKVALPHECNDIDLAVWLSDFSQLKNLQLAQRRGLASPRFHIGLRVSPRQIDTFLFAAESGNYRGRLCAFSPCPAHQAECGQNNCGDIPYLRVIPGFTLHPDALAAGQSRELFLRPFTPANP
jgi:hypothetical protein